MRNVEVVVVIATSMGRSDLLIERSLYSVYQQQDINPCCIYVVDDNEDENGFERLKERVKALRQRCFLSEFDTKIPHSHFHTRVIRNSRSRGRSGSGAWNCGALHAYRNYGKGRKTYLAILDDDDAWHPDYLNHCVRVVSQSEQYVAGVISSFYRCEPDGDKPVIVHRSKMLVENFLIGNPGWQGSNTFVEMTAFWKAGGYDESMYSTHDRDFAIRFLDACFQNNDLIDTISMPLMRHYVHDGERVTTCFTSKKQGLDAFYRKYACRMTDATLEQSLGRAKQLFGYTYLKDAVVSQSPAAREEELLQAYQDAKPLHIIIGVVSSDADNVRSQLDSIFQQLQIEPQFAGYCHYVVMTNGQHEEKIKEVMVSPKRRGLTLNCVDLIEQEALYDCFPFADNFANEKLDRKSIAHSRSLLQFYCAKLAKGYGESCVVLILDDDLCFESLLLEGNIVKSIRLNFLGKVAYFRRESKASILVSAYSDAPPLPFYSSMRTQLLDVLYTLRLLLVSDQASLELPATVINPSLHHQSDYYYDLSSASYCHLEQPLPWLGVDRDSDLKGGELLKSFLVDFQYLTQEANITRPLLLDEQAWFSLTGDVGYARGGIAIYLDTDLLSDIPHLSPFLTLGGEARRSRRSDFISAIAMREIYEKTVESISFPLRHNRRRQNPPCHISDNKLLDDVIGLCFYRTFRHSLTHPQLSTKRVQAHFNHNIRETLGKMKVNNLRILQLLIQLERLLTCDVHLLERVSNDGFLAEQVDGAIKAVKYIQKELSKRKFNQQLRAVKKSVLCFDVIRQIEDIKQMYRAS